MIEDPRTATRIGELADERYQRDMRFRRTVQSAVQHIMHEHGEIDRDRPEQDAYVIATKVATLLYERIYQEDGELLALRQERDAYKKFAEESAGIRPMPPIFLAAASPIMPPKPEAS